MKTPPQILIDLDRWLERRWQAAILSPGEDWPRRINIGAPSSAALESDFPAVLDWVHRWQDWAKQHGAELDVVSRRVAGTAQMLPSRLIIPDLDMAAQLLGGRWPERVAAARARSSAVLRRFPYVDPVPLLRELTELSTVDFDVLLTAAAWFRSNDATGLTPRQVPIEGLDSKWLNTSQHLVRAISGKGDLGLVERPRTAHFTYLDPQHLANGGRRYDTITEGDTPSPCYLPKTVLITENKDSALFFPDLEQAIVIQGVGKAGPAVIPLLPWVTGSDRVLYWGDLDAEGFEIVNLYRSRGLSLNTILMDCSTLHVYGRFGVTHDSKGRSAQRQWRALPLLTATERAAYEQLTDPLWAGPYRVEQERIPLETAHAMVLTAF